MSFRLVFPWGPTPKDPEQARLLGAEQEQLRFLIESSDASGFMYCHREGLPELVAMVRAMGRDCTVGPFAEHQAWLRLHAAG